MKRLRAFVGGIEIGSRKPLLVRRESVSHIGLNQRVLYASDLHLRNLGPRHIVEELVEVAAMECPDLILLGGDLVDWSNGLEALQFLVQKLSWVAPVGAVAGNHDRWAGESKVRNAVLAGGGRWLNDAPWLLSSNCAIYGSGDQPVQASRYHLLCTHHPGISSRGHHFDLTLSGHLHGGQIVFYERRGRLYPGAFFYRWNGLRFDEGEKTLLISRGVQDTLPIRWNCPREVLIVDI